MSWLCQLIHVGLDQRSLRGLGAVAHVIAQATDASGVLLWEETQLDGMSLPCLMTVWPDDRFDYGGFAPLADPATLTVFRERTPALPRGHMRDVGGNTSWSVVGAWPVDWSDGGRGALTLLGENPLTDEALDVLAGLIDVLPKICGVVKERQTLALLNACNEILRAADAASPTQALAHDELSLLLSKICLAIAEDLRFAAVSIFLHRPGHASNINPLFATSEPVPPDAPGVSTQRDRRNLVVVPISHGRHLWGTIECEEVGGLPSHITGSSMSVSSMSVLAPVADQVALYWSQWLHRQEISDENRCWRNLASGVTQLNEQIRDQLGRRRPQREPVYHAAFQVIHKVVSECTAVDVRVEERDGPAGRAVAVPIQVGEAVYGVLEASGSDGTLPPNSTQVCQIIADQLGLYHFLHETLRNLRETQKMLEHTMASQAMAMEDIKHQLVSPLVAATAKTESLLQRGRLDSRADIHLRAVRGLCRRAGRVALSAGVFSMLSKGRLPSPRSELLGVDDLLRLVILSADDAQVLIDPRRQISIDVERASFRSIGRRLVQADRSFLEQCIGNLVDNAAKYSYEATTVEIGGTADETSLLICVTSRGIPIHPKDAERCLQRNWRGRAARAATGEGSGLGLWIVDNLTRSMNGAVEVVIAGDTTTVRLRLPFS